jgi:hypothetical protein
MMAGQDDLESGRFQYLRARNSDVRIVVGVKGVVEEDHRPPPTDRRVFSAIIRLLSIDF